MRLAVRLSAVATCAAAAFALAGCTDDEPSAAPEPTASSSPAPSAAETLIETGLEQIAAEDYLAAQGTFTSVLTLEPSNVYALYNLGYIAQAQDDVATAVTQYSQAIAVDPEFAPALYNLALLTEDADLQAAVDLYRRVLEQSPDDAATYMRLGFALQELGEDEAGQEALDKGIELDPSLADVKPPKYK